MNVIWMNLRGLGNVSMIGRHGVVASFCTSAPQISPDNNVDKPVSDMENPFKRDKIQCVLCRHKVTVDYKNVKLLSQFVSPYTGRIYGRHITRLCSTQQKKVEKEILKSQNAGLMAFYLKEVEFLDDPKLFSPEQPIRQHRF